jgi:outer membrane protein assembly factor BamB
MYTKLISRVLVCACLTGAAVASPQAAVQIDDSRIAARIMQSAGISNGLCAMVTHTEDMLPVAMAGVSEVYIHVQVSDAAASRSLADAVDDAGLYGTRITVEQGRPSRLPYAANVVDLVIIPDLTVQSIEQLSIQEITRVLRPGGKAFIGSRSHSNEFSARELEDRLHTAGAPDVTVEEGPFGVWAQFTKPPLAGTDEWSHWEHGPDNNPVSQDQVIQAPYMTQWFGGPLYIAMPAITTAAGGRTFIAMGHIAHHQREEPWLNTLYARNGYNGAHLWTKKLPDGYLAHRSAFIATGHTFYMIDTDGNGCLLLNPESGEEKGSIQIPEYTGEWKWMAMQDHILYALIGKDKDPPQTTLVRSSSTAWSWGELSRGYYSKRIPWGFGETLVAYDTNSGKVLWSHSEQQGIDSRGMALGGGKVFFYAPDSRIGCLDAYTGTELWTNSDSKIRELVEEKPLSRLLSTPGFRTSCFCVYTPQVLLYQGQTRKNLTAVSTKDGSILWQRDKTTNNPNVINIDGRLIAGIGPEGSHLVLNPLTGDTIEDLGFKKRSCARLTATWDSFFCRGWPEGLTRYDRLEKQVLFNGAVRPACNDGIIAAHGMLYVGPWLCDCNLSLQGAMGLCTAGDFDFEQKASVEERLSVASAANTAATRLLVTPDDWPTYRNNNTRNASSRERISGKAEKRWEHHTEKPVQSSAPTAAGGLIFVSSKDGIVRAYDAASGDIRWNYKTAGPVTEPPTIWNGRAYIGSGDGYIYAIDAATGNLHWKFRAAPVERRIMVYGSLASTWPVNSGILIQGGVAYAAAGIIDYDGTYVYALDAATGNIQWQNTTSGHLDKQLHKGVSAQGHLTVAQGRLWMPGGNVISPAAYDLQTGRYLGKSPGDGSPQANRGEEIGVFGNDYVVLGGKLRYSSRNNIVNPGAFTAHQILPGESLGEQAPLNMGKTIPVWNDSKMVMVHTAGQAPVCYAAKDMQAYLQKGYPVKMRNAGGFGTQFLKQFVAGLPSPLWQGNTLDNHNTVSMALAENAVVVVSEAPRGRSLWNSTWKVSALDLATGNLLWQHALPSAATPGGLLIDRDGQVIVVLEDGSVLCYGQGA